MRFGIDNIETVVPTQKIGDALCFSALPENYFKYYGKKLIHKQNHWVYAHNPYVDRESKSEYTVNPTDIVNKFDIENGYSLGQYNKGKLFSISERMALAFGCALFLRTPRLYIHENVSPRKQITLHTQAISEYHPFPEYIISTIVEKYPDYDICHIGGPYDPALNNSAITDKRGLNLWDTVRCIADSEIFIGVMSGPMHLANCLDKVRKKAFVLKENESLVFTHGLFGEWIDYGWEYYNKTDRDIGVTKSYLKI